MTKRERLVGFCLVLAGLLAAGCGGKKDSGGGGGSGNCLVDTACCALAAQEAGDDADPSEYQNGQEGCEGSDINTEGEWCDKAAELAKKALNAESAEGTCVLGLKANTVTRVPVLWVTSTSEDKVAKFDSVSGEEVLRVVGYGDYGNRTAVATDGSVWVTNRDSYQYVHFGVDGEPVCSSKYGEDPPHAGAILGATVENDETGCARAAAIDSDGNVWIGFNGAGAGCESRVTDLVVKVSGTEVEDEMVTLTDPNNAETTIEVPRCKELARLELTSAKPYGLAADGDGNVWTGVLTGSYIAKIDAKEDVVVGEYNLTEDPLYATAAVDGGLGNCVALYGMTMGADGHPWYANTTCTGAHAFKVNRDTGKIMKVTTSPTDPAELGGAMPLSYCRSMGIDNDGNVWCADFSYPYAHRFSPDGEWMSAVNIVCPDVDGEEGPAFEETGSGLLGIGSDIDGNMWVSMYTTGRVAKFTVDGEVLGCYPELDFADTAVNYGKLASPYTYSDLTGSSNSLVASQLGRWRGIVEQEEAVQWAAIGWEGSIPENTSVCLRVRAADTQAGLESESFSTEFCMPEKVGPFFIVNLIDGGDPVVAASKFLELELKLASTDEGATPEVKNLSVAAVK